jgi:probable HAF family extracellular repeat protein
MTWGTVIDAHRSLITDAHQVAWRNGVMSDLTALGLERAVAVNDAGIVLGGQHDQGVFFLPGPGTTEPVPGFDEDAWPADINNAGDVTGHVHGQAVIARGNDLIEIPVPTGYGFIEPAAINNARGVTGTARPSRTDDSTQRAILFTDGAVTVLDPAPGAKSSSATDLNDASQVVGHAGRVGMHSIQLPGHAFLYDPNTDTMVDLGTLPGDEISGALAINNLGQVVGFSWLPQENAPAIRRAFLYDHRTRTMSDLNALISPESGWQLLEATDINDAGQIVGQGLMDNETHAFMLTPVR